MNTIRKFLSSQLNGQQQQQQQQQPHQAHSYGHGRDPEQGYRPAHHPDTGGRTAATQPSPSSPPPPRVLTVKTIDPNALIPHEDKLLIFRTLTGIDTVPVVTTHGHEIRSAPNLGIYNRVTKSETEAHERHRRLNLLSKLLYCLQIIVGAALTALSAAKGSYRALTGLAVINTISAGLVTFFKASDIPDKYKHDEAEWRKIREYVEQRERELCLASNNLDVYHEVRVVEDMYRRIKAGIEAKGNSQSNTIDETSLVPDRQYQRQESVGVGSGGGGGGTLRSDMDGSRSRFGLGPEDDGYCRTCNRPTSEATAVLQGSERGPANNNINEKGPVSGEKVPDKSPPPPLGEKAEEAGGE